MKLAKTAPFLCTEVDLCGCDWQLEVFRKTLMRSLQEEDDTGAASSEVVAKPTELSDDSCVHFHFHFLRE